MSDKLIIRKPIDNLYAIEFCKNFIESNRPKYIFGGNEYTKSILSLIEVDGIIDEFTKESEFCSIPIVPLNKIPNNALVISAVMGKQFFVEKKLNQFQFEFIHYYTFYRYSKLKLKNIYFQEGVKEDILNNLPKHENIYQLLKDDISKNQFYNILNFRVSYDIRYLRGFSNLEYLQYFEEFLNLQDGEVFVDVGGYDGFTSEEFIKRCPNYKSIHIFEPDEKNIKVISKRLNCFKNITIYPNGLSNEKKELRFKSDGISSKVCEDGENIINVDKLDNILNDKPTFIKMDIEGGELDAIEGAKMTIEKYHPKLAISVYHLTGDLWKIPEKIFDIRGDYDIYLRHYTECVMDTVMFFIPNKK